MVTLKSASQIEQMRSPGGSSPTSSTLVERELSRASPPPSSTRSPSDTSARGRAIPSFIGAARATRTLPAPLCISIDDEVVHGIPGKRAIRGRPGRVGRRRRHRRGWHGDAARTFIVRRRRDRRPRRAGRDDPARRCWPASRRPRPGNSSATSRRAVEDVAPAGYGIVRSSSATASAPRCTRSPGPQLPHRPTGAASSSPGCAWPSSRCSRSAATRSGRPRRRLDGRHRATAAWPPTGSTPSRSPADGPAILTTV